MFIFQTKFKWLVNTCVSESFNCFNNKASLVNSRSLVFTVGATFVGHQTAKQKSDVDGRRKLFEWPLYYGHRFMCPFHYWNFFYSGDVYNIQRLFIWFALLTKKELRNFPIRLIMALCVTIGLSQIVLLLSFAIPTSVLCIPLAIGIHYLFMASFVWSVCIAVNFFLMIIR